jgi:hypothetical protein
MRLMRVVSSPPCVGPGNAQKEQGEAVDVLKLHEVQFEVDATALSHARIQVEFLLFDNAGCAIEI